MQVYTSLQTNKPFQHPTTLFFTGQMPFLPPNQQRQSTEGSVSIKLRRNVTEASLAIADHLIC